MADYEKHQGVRFVGHFKADGTLTNPTSVSFFTVNPNGTQAEYEYVDANSTCALVSTGIYKCDVVLNRSGDWYYRWMGTTAVQAASEGKVSVETTQTDQ